MAKRKLTNKLIKKEEITEDLKLIKESSVDYITPSGKIYCDYGNNMFYPKSTFINKNNGYLYVAIKSKEGKEIQRRVHRLVAEAFLPNPENLKIVMHIDNDKSNPNVNNLKWGTTSENTKDAYRDNLASNKKGFEDSQSMPVVQLNLNKELINTFGSVSIASQATGVTKSGILYQCNHKVKTKNRKPKCGFYFRYLSEFNESGFIL